MFGHPGKKAGIWREHNAVKTLLQHGAASIIAQANGYHLWQVLAHERL